MDDVRSPIYAAEPYEESQGRDSEVASPDALAAFYRDMERKEIVERKFSKRSKTNSGTSIWSRKLSLKRSTAPPVPPPEHKPHRHRLDTEDTTEEDREIGSQDKPSEKSDWVPQMNSSRSIVPDPLKELPAWYNKEAWDVIPLPAHQVRYHIHNPVGPRWYKNHHLLPPSLKTPAARPPSVFSPSFPPMASTSQERLEHTTHIPVPSITPSNTPIPTPNSSQTRVVDANGKPRTRKTSQTAHDTVDLLDVTDPWGTNWHHHSPYDVGLTNGPISIDVQDTPHTRSRRSSLTAQSRRKTIIPSPLSQSTSAVHLQPPDTGAHIPRKLSKRRTPTLGNLFGASQDPSRQAESLPVSPVEPATGPSVDNRQPSELPKRMSIAPPTGPPVSSAQSTLSKKEKRGSMLGRLVKKFSVMRKATSAHTKANGREDDLQHVNSGEVSTNKPLSYGGALDRQSSPEKPHSDAMKRIPPPSIDDTSTKKPEGPPKEADRSSSFSFEAPFSIGRLTIANPDSPGSSDTTPTQRELPLPPDRFEHIHSDILVPSTSLPKVSPITHPPEKLTIDNPLPATSMKSSRYDPSTITSTLSRAPSPPTPPEKPKVPSLHPALSVASYATRTSFDHPAEKLNKHPSQPVASSSQPVASFSQHSLQPADRRMSRSSDRTQTGPLTADKTQPASLSSSVPFPATQSGDRGESYDYSPLSASSMLANPPTPYTADTPMPATPEAPPPPLPTKRSQDSKHTSGTHLMSQTSRQTEKFRLVRSPSGHVYETNEAIVAGGQQWEVVEAHDAKGKLKKSSKSRDRHHSEDRDSRVRDSKREFKDRESKDKKDREHKNRKDREPRDKKNRESNDRTSTSKRERKRESRSNAEPDDRTNHHDRLRSHLRERHDSEEGSTSTAMATIGSSDWQSEANYEHQDPGKSSRRISEDRERRSEWRQFEVPSAALNVNKPQPAPPPPTPGAPLSHPLERHPSISARPTSELPSAADMNAMRAKESWEMERLWKARSMHGNESNGYTTIPSGSTPLMGAITTTDPHGAIHGSSHTAFVVQTPFQDQHSIYHSMPAAPPPIIYASPASIHSMSRQLTSSHNNYTHQRFNSDSMSEQKSLTSSIYSPLANPLPDPPRASSYELPPLLDSNRRPTDYWTTYTGVTTLH